MPVQKTSVKSFSYPCVIASITLVVLSLVGESPGISLCEQTNAKRWSIRGVLGQPDRQQWSRTGTQGYLCIAQRERTFINVRIIIIITKKNKERREKNTTLELRGQIEENVTLKRYNTTPEKKKFTFEHLPNWPLQQILFLILCRNSSRQHPLQFCALCSCLKVCNQLQI